MAGHNVLPITSICGQVGLDFEREKSTMVFAIHPGGPAILTQIRLSIARRALWAEDIGKRRFCVPRG